MATTTTTHRAPRLTGITAATIAAGLALTIGLQASDHLSTPASQTQPATQSEQVTSTADLGAVDPVADPLRVLSDLSPVVAAQMSVAATTQNPFEVMSDLTPVISAHVHPQVSTIDPFQDMRDLTPTISALKINNNE